MVLSIDRYSRTVAVPATPSISASIRFHAPLVLTGTVPVATVRPAALRISSTPEVLTASRQRLSVGRSVTPWAMLRVASGSAVSLTYSRSAVSGAPEVASATNCPPEVVVTSKTLDIEPCAATEAS